MRIEIPSITIRIHGDGSAVDLTPILTAIGVLAQKIDALVAGASAEDQQALSESLASIKALLTKADTADGKVPTPLDFFTGQAIERWLGQQSFDAQE